MKKQFVKPALALVLTILLGACESPISPAPKAAVPDGKGLVRVETGAAAARTAVPVVNFARYEYWFAKDGGAPAQQEPAAGVFELEAGSYTVTVRAFVAAGDAAPATEGTSDAFTITAGVDAGAVTVVLMPVIGAGAGTLSFNLAFPDAAAVTALTLTRVGGTESYDLLKAGTGGTGTLAGTLSAIGAGYWLARASLQKGEVYAGKSEVAHIYDGMATELSWTFAAEIFAAIPVTRTADSGPGTLREALTRANAGLGGKIFVDLPAGGNTITLATPLPPLATSLAIEGNGATLTREFASGADTLLNISNPYVTVTIRRLHFTGGATGYGAAINSVGELVLESCIFSGNRADIGGAIYISGNTATVKGCTFYNNSATTGGAIYCVNSSAILLTGNLFFRNPSKSSIVDGTDVLSYGYNVSDTVAGNGWSGYVFVTGDVGNVSYPIHPANFKPFFDSAALNRLPGTLPPGYPAVDFYGAAINANGASGAVQTAAAPGYYLEYGVASGQGTVHPDSPPGAEGLYASSSAVTLRAGYEPPWTVRSWTVNGEESGSGDTLVVTMDSWKTVQVSFAQDITVYNEAELRAALSQQAAGDVIRFGADITLTAVLPSSSNITIEGNGHILTQTGTFGGLFSTTTSLLPISNGTVRRLHFKDGSSTNFGGAINAYGTTVLESCIFSGNQTGTSGGAIYIQSGDITVTGCTFYDNHAGESGGAIYLANSFGSLSLTGNLFFGNTASSGGNVVYGSNITSHGYNVSDKGSGLITASAGNSQTASGYVFADGDAENLALPISPANFKPFSDSAALNKLPGTLPAGYPALDFYGTAIAADGASGAVQTPAVGWHLDYGADGAGRVEPTESPNADGLYANGASVTLTAVEGAGGIFVSWTVDGGDRGSNKTLTVTMDTHKTVRALFTQNVTVYDEAGLRAALDKQTEGDIVRFGADITLAAVLPQITKSIAIEGDGHTLTRTFASETSGSPTSLLHIQNTATVSVRRLHFKDGLANSIGAAIQNQTGNLTVESCIFSNNHSSNFGGAAIGISGGSLTVKGCTFYNNRVSTPATYAIGGAIYREGGTVALTGNLFFGNTTARNIGNVAYGDSITSFGYNVSDKGDGLIASTSVANAGTASGYAFVAGDAGDVAMLPISPVNFKPITGGAAYGRLPSPLPDGYPAEDFYGVATSAAGASGAVQTAAAGYYLDHGVASGEGTITPNIPPNADGLYTGSPGITLTATPAANFVFHSWTIDGADGGAANPLGITMDAHKTVLAVFKPLLAVNDEAGLRAALNWQEDGNLITFGNNISLAATLPQITKSITIEGNGHTLTRTFAAGASTNLLYINASSATVTVRRLCFKDGLSTSNAAAIRNTGNLTLESCIFSGNEAGTYGGAIFSAGSLTVRGCTFHNNRVTGTGTTGSGGAIYRAGGTVMLTGNLFSGNTAAHTGNVVYGTVGVTSYGYNVSDREAGVITGTGASVANRQSASGYAGAAGDLFSVTDIAFDGAFKPSSATGLKTLTAPLPEDFPAAYFNGSSRTTPATAGAMPAGE